MSGNELNADIERDEHTIEWTNKKIGKLWSFYSKNDVFKKLYFSYQAGDQVLKYIRRLIQVDTLGTILDYGCGQGHMLKHILSQAHTRQKCYGLDFSEASVKLVNHKLTKHRNFFGACRMNGDRSEYPDSCMDLIFVLEVIEHLDNEQLHKMKTETMRLLKHGGYIVITTPNKENLDEGKTICPDCGCIFHQWQHIRSWSSDILVSDMENFGFKTVHVNETNFRIKNYYLAELILKFIPAYKHNLIYIARK